MKFPERSPTARLILTLSLGPLLAGQSTPESGPLVNLDVTVVDGADQPVPGLRAEDFQILDNGKPQKIVRFHALSRAVSSQVAPRYSNRGVIAAPATFILFDLFNEDFSVRGYSANELTHALEGLDSGGEVYLYLLTPGAKIVAVHGVESAGAQTAPGGDPWTRRAKPILDEALRQVAALKPVDDRDPHRRLIPTWDAMEGFVSQIAEVPGPKSFIWITQGIPGSPGDPAKLDFTANLNALDTAVYPVFMRSGPGFPRGMVEELSSLTGGRLYLGTPGKAIQEAFLNARNMNYQMAFAPEKPDGKYHKISVTVKRKDAGRDIKIQTEGGYYATNMPHPHPGKELIEGQLAQSKTDYPGIGLAASAVPVEGKPGQFRFTIFLDAPDVTLRKEGTGHKGAFTITLVEMGSQGERTSLGSTLAYVDMSEEEYAKAMKDGIEATRQATIDPATRQVRIVVLDRSSDSTLAGAGSVTVPLDRNP